MDDPAALAVVAGAIRARLDRGDLAGLTLAPAGGEEDWITLEDFARATLAEVDDYLAFVESGEGRVHPAAWHNLVGRLRLLERAAHRRGR
jgi:hypothetical protein